MAKILIAGIGGGKKEKGKYRTTSYSINENGKTYIYEDRAFVTSALEEHYKIDKTIYIGTAGSMWENLYEHYCQKYNIEQNEEYVMKLMEVVDSANKDTEINSLDLSYFNQIFEGKVEGRVTKYGTKETEIFENFAIIMNLQDALNDGDEIYIDVTHSFRSNAIWMFLVLNYISDVLNKNLEIKMISYGMFEITKDQVTPIIDLNAFYKILKWIKGAHSFREFGNSYPFLDMIDNNDINKKLKTFSDAMNMNYIGGIKNNLKSLKEILPMIEAMQGPAQLLIPKIVKDFIKQFDGVEEDYLVQARLAKWHFLQKRYAMAYINLNQALVSFIEIELIPDRNNKNNRSTDMAKKWLRKLGTRKNNEFFKADKDNIRLLKYFKIYEHSRQVRNDIAHALGKKDSTINDITSLASYCKDIEDMLKAKELIKRKEQEFNWLQEN